MAEHEDAGDSSKGAGDDGKGCVPAQKLLDSITAELNSFEAKKLGELKKDLEGFVARQGQLVDDYKKQYAALKKQWCDQQTEIDALSRAIRCAVPTWKEIITKCVCPPQADIRCQEQSIANRKRCCKGTRERTRDDAQARFDDAKAYLDALIANAAGLKAALEADAKLIKEITGLLTGADQTVAVYLFWFKLLPQHNSIAPADCKTIGADETLEKLCSTEFGKPCGGDPNPCTPPKDEAAGDAAKPHHPAPWLVDPAKYATELDCAWSDRRDAKDAFAKADAAYKTKPDDLKALEDKLTAAKKGLDEEIKKCLKDQKQPGDPCCDDAATKQGAENA